MRDHPIFGPAHLSGPLPRGAAPLPHPPPRPPARARGYFRATCTPRRAAFSVSMDQGIHSTLTTMPKIDAATIGSSNGQLGVVSPSKDRRRKRCPHGGANIAAIPIVADTPSSAWAAKDSALRRTPAPHNTLPAPHPAAESPGTKTPGRRVDPGSASNHEAAHRRQPSIRTFHPIHDLGHHTRYRASHPPDSAGGQDDVHGNPKVGATPKMDPLPRREPRIPSTAAPAMTTGTKLIGRQSNSKSSKARSTDATGH